VATTQTNGAFFVILDDIRTYFHQALAEMKDARAKRRIYEDTYAKLATMSDRNLRDLGISRSGIERLALEAAYDV